jgi:uncharacterized integral membrane protein
MSERGRQSSQPGIGGLSYRTIAGLVVALLIVVFIAMNRDETEISFIVFSTQTALWVALTVAAAGGFVAGFLIGRHRYRG